MQKIKQDVTIIYKTLKQAFHEWLSKDPFRESAVIAYYAIFSLPGLLVILITTAGYIFGRESVTNHLSAQITATLGKQTSDQVLALATQSADMTNSVLATIIGIVTIILGASGVFTQFQKSLNFIWEVEPQPAKTGIRNFIKVRILSFGLILSIAFILITSLVVTTLLAAMGEWFSNRFPLSLVVWLQIANTLFSFIIISFLFALMFKFLPDKKITWREVRYGAMMTAFLFEIGKFGLGVYFGFANPASVYGAAGSVILVMLWVSYSSMIVFYGAEFTRAYSDEIRKNPH